MVNYFVRILCIGLLLGYKSYGQGIALDNAMHHLRNGESREWSEFPLDANEKELLIHFRGRVNVGEQTLSLQQYDVKQNWKIQINNREIGSLVIDEQAMMTYYSIPSNLLLDGENKLQIKCSDATSDDIKVGNIQIDTRQLKDVLSEAVVEINVVENDSRKNLPCRLTIINHNRILQTVTSPKTAQLAIRPGVVYSGGGTALLHLPAGRYTLFAGRGVEYSVDSIQLELKAGDRIKKTLQLKREVDTEGWISSDTHIHTFTHSRHGDASIEERAVTIAGEGIELPILTDHNLNIDLSPAAKAMGVAEFFTPVTGNELTTKFGHFNVFKTTVGAPAIDHEVKDWNDVLENIGDAKSRGAVILNHARDIHHGFRPFGPERHISSAGTSMDDWKFPANAMEVINSGSQQTHIMNLFHDWFGMLNRGYFLTPAGSSDSHDVSRYIVGQGRTYIQCNDKDPGKINADEAIRNFRDGKVMVSLGLMTKILVNDQYGPGDIAPYSNRLTVTIEVSGPSWTNADRLVLYSNGKKIREELINTRNVAGIKWKRTWTLQLPKHDIFLVAIAEGPGQGMPYWPIAKPYQPASTDWTPKLMGSTGVVWFDGDKNGRRNSAFDYAKAIVDTSKGDVDNIVKQLSAFDEAVAIQAAVILWKQGKILTSPEITKALKNASAEVKSGFEVATNEIKLLKPY
jgi:hypothetical protein